MYRLLYIIFLLSLFLFCRTQTLVNYVKTTKSEIKNLKLSKQKIYLLSRGTTTKSDLIAKQFNLNDTFVTHIGIGFFRKGKFNIYNVTTGADINSALKINTIEEFITSEDVYSLSIWKIKLNKNEREKIKDYCGRYAKIKIIFDYKFNISKDSILYCSEFCVNALQFTNPNKFNFIPTIKTIEGTLLELLLNKKTFSYYPIDFFRGNVLFTQFHSFIFKPLG